MYQEGGWFSQQDPNCCSESLRAPRRAEPFPPNQTVPPLAINGQLLGVSVSDLGAGY